MRIQPRHSADASSPYAVREGRTITVMPDEITFQVPEEWLQQDKERKLHLSWEELDGMSKIKPHGIEFDDEDAAVMDAVITFDRCAAHFGSSGWNNNLWNDLQGRVYIVDLSADAFAERVKAVGLNEATNLFESAELASLPYRDWQLHSIKVLDAPTHFMLFKKINFYYKRYANKGVVFAFVQPGGFEDTIAEILGSVGAPGSDPPPRRRQ